MRILAISGSLRAASSNTVVVRGAVALARGDLQVVHYDALASLPHFNPDMDRALDDPELPAAVRDLRTQVGAADALLISSPEYAHGVPGSLKNALDWLVGGSEMPGKPVALITTSSRATYAQTSLAETLRTMSANVVDGSPFLAPVASPGPDDTGGAHSSGAGTVLAPAAETALAAAFAALASAVAAG